MRRKKKQWWGEGDIFYDIEAFRLFLGPTSYKYTDAQLKQLQMEMRTLAEILVDYWQIKQGLRKPDQDDSGLSSNPEEDQRK